MNVFEKAQKNLKNDMIGLFFFLDIKFSAVSFSVFYFDSKESSFFLFFEEE